MNKNTYAFAKQNQIHLKAVKGVISTFTNPITIAAN